QGKPLRHPLHPILIHIPIALFLLAIVLDAATWLTEAGDSELVRGAFYALAGGVVAALVAAVPGFVDWADIRRDHPARPTATTHMILNLLAVGGYGLRLLLRYHHPGAARTPV